MSDSSRPLHIVLGVGGGIAAYKVASLLRIFTEAGHDVVVVPTPSALNFVGSATWEALSGHPVVAEVWDNVPEVPHVSIGKQADLVVVAPATADLMSRAAHGAANDLLTNVLLTATCPVLFAPAMHTEMWQNSATQANVATLRSRGYSVLEPAVGRLTGADTGAGRMPEPQDIADAAMNLISTRQDLAGKSFVITAGGTREYLDPVRYLGNRSSGKQGIALAQAAVARGAIVTLVAANVSEPMPAGCTVVRVETSVQLASAVLAAAADVVIMAAAVADFTPVHMSTTKMKKSDDGSSPTIELQRTQDILAELVARRNANAIKQIIVGFAAETGDDSSSVIQHGRAKLARKGCDVLVVNDVSGDRVFGQSDNEVTILEAASSAEIHIARTTKREVADAVVDVVANLLQ